MLKIVELGAEIIIIFFILSKLEEFGFQLRDNEILLVGFNLGRVKILETLEKLG